MAIKSRSALLEALCILSFTGNGLAILTYLSAALFSETARTRIRDWSSLYDVSRFTTSYFLILTALYLISIFGVVQMWKMKNRGFLLYAAAQGIILFFPSLWLDRFYLPSVTIIFTLLFTGLYAREMFGKKPHSLEP